MHAARRKCPLVGMHELMTDYLQLHALSAPANNRIRDKARRYTTPLSATQDLHPVARKLGLLCSLRLSTKGWPG